jgi:tetratricopeptide (TPR) repeat protein
MGRFDEALAEIRRAQELDPLSLIISAIAGWPYRYTGQPDKAIEQFKKTLEMDSNFMPAHYYLGLAYLDKGMYEEALSEFKIANNVIYMGIAYAKMGKTAEARQVLNDMIEQSKQEYVASGDLAAIYFALGDSDQGFTLLERAYEEREDKLAGIKVNPLFDSFRSDPRFKKLLKKMKLEKPER